MNGVPHMEVMRSISLYGLSDVILTFAEDTDDYFARQVVFERIGRCAASGRRDPLHGAAVQPQRPGVSLRAGKPGPHAAGAEDVSKTGWWSALTARCRAWRTIPVLAAPPCSTRCCSIRRRIYGYHLTVPQVMQCSCGEQFQRRGRVLFAGRPVLLRARHRLAAGYGGHRQHRGGRPTMACPFGCAISARSHRPRAAPGRIRLSRRTTTPWKA